MELLDVLPYEVKIAFFGALAFVVFVWISRRIREQMKLELGHEEKNDSASSVQKFALKLANVLHVTPYDKEFLEKITELYGKRGSSLIVSFKALQLFAMDITLFKICKTDEDLHEARSSLLSACGGLWEAPGMIDNLLWLVEEFFMPAADNILKCESGQELMAILSAVFARILQTSGVDENARFYSLGFTGNNLLFFLFVHC
jgi:hypothetical protein